MLKQNTAITARRCSTAITLVLRRPNTHWRGSFEKSPEGSTQKNVMRIAGIVDVGDCCFAKAQVSTAFVSPLR